MKSPADEPVKWLTNIQTLKDSFKNITEFDESLNLDRPNSAYHIVGAKSLQYDLNQYQIVFP